jgi:glycosyltransferase involved in cell wall biosynthesis
MAAPRLTIAITTRNRAGFIGETLDTILPQLTDEVEVLVLDGASTDDTPAIIEEYCHRFPRLRYVRQDVNNGPDRDFSRSVELSSGEYCWLMADDDLLRPGAVAAVLDATQGAPSLVIVNAEVRNVDMSRVLEPRRLQLTENCDFTPAQWDDFFALTASYLSFIGCVVIKRTVWLERDKETYYGSLFIHVGVIFQRPLPDRVLILADPLISIRYGNAKWQPQQFEIWMLKWPALLWSFQGISTDAKRAVTAPRRWREVDRLVFYRAQGSYTLTEYRQWIRPRADSLWERFLGMSVACIPSVLANTLAVVGCWALRGRSVPGKPAPDMVLLDLKSSRYYLGNWLIRLRQA